MTALLVGYARVSTDQQDLTSQRDGLAALGVAPNRIYVDHGLTGINRDRPGLREALTACREGDTRVVTKLDRLARSLPDARSIADELTVRQVSLNLGGSVYDPTGPVGRLLFNVLAGWRCSISVSTPQLNWQTCSASAAPLCIAPSNESGH
jgi:DNA invertase Pin-like site-specific DNA recombinase